MTEFASENIRILFILDIHNFLYKMSEIARLPLSLAIF